jgi:rubredoxin
MTRAAGWKARARQSREPTLIRAVIQMASRPAPALRAVGIRLLEFVDFTLTAAAMKKYMCLICGWIYDEELGAPEEGIPPGTKWEDVPPNWTCPECGARKDDFEMIEF